MPSGAKKRKAAKRKKEKEANNSNSADHSPGNDDLKHHDEKESDGWEVNSPASQDHQSNQHPFTEGEEEEVEKREDNSSIRNFIDENKSMEGVNNNDEGRQKVAIEEEAVVQTERELKPEHESGSKNITIEYIEPARKSYDGSSSVRSSSSSDDDSHDAEKNTVVVETAPVVDSDKPVDYLSEVITQVDNSIPVREAYSSVVEMAPVVDSEKYSLLEEVFQVNESASIVNSTINDAVGSVLKENVDKRLPSLDENTGVSPNVVDLGSQKVDEELVSMLKENAAASSDAKDFATLDNEDKLALSFNAPRVDTSNGVEHTNDSEIPECSDSQGQPLVAPNLRPVQTSSWKSCCGLFEVFTGSSR